MACYSDFKLEITNHARQRMSNRSINDWQVELVLQYGRLIHRCDAHIYAIGRKEIEKNGRFLESCDGIHVLCASVSGTVITTYRNHSLKKLRPITIRSNRRKLKEMI